MHFYYSITCLFKLDADMYPIICCLINGLKQLHKLFNHSISYLLIDSSSLDQKYHTRFFISQLNFDLLYYLHQIKFIFTKGNTKSTNLVAFSFHITFRPTKTAYSKRVLFPLYKIIIWEWWHNLAFTVATWFCLPRLFFTFWWSMAFCLQFIWLILNPS